MTSPGHVILVADAEVAMQRALRRVLRVQGYRVVTAESGEDVVALAEAAPPSIVLLDVGLPGLDATDVIGRLRVVSGATPIIVLGGETSSRTKVRVLDGGADDYVVKPFSTPELLARVRAALRRLTRQTTDARFEAARLVRGAVEIDTTTRRVWVRSQPVVLTPTQYELMQCFARHPGRVLEHRLIAREVWSEEGGASREDLRAFVWQLRRKIEIDPTRPNMIVTEPGVGYRFVP